MTGEVFPGGVTLEQAQAALRWSALGVDDIRPLLRVGVPPRDAARLYDYVHTYCDEAEFPDALAVTVALVEAGMTARQVEKLSVSVIGPLSRAVTDRQWPLGDLARIAALLAPRGLTSPGWSSLLENLDSVDDLDLACRASQSGGPIYAAAWLVKAGWPEDDIFWAMRSLPRFLWSTESDLVNLAALDDPSVRRLAAAIASVSSTVTVDEAVRLAQGVEVGRLEAAQLVLDGMSVDEALVAARLLAQPASVTVRRALPGSPATLGVGS